jgi:CBS domain-containing protein
VSARYRELMFIGWFLNNAALMSYRQPLTREALEGIPVSRLMQTRFETVRRDTSMRDLVEDHLLRSVQRAFPVTSDHRLEASVAAGDDAYEALSVLAQRGLSHLPVLEEGRLRGLLRREEILGWLALHEEPAYERSRFFVHPNERAAR